MFSRLDGKLLLWSQKVLIKKSWYWNNKLYEKIYSIHILLSMNYREIIVPNRTLTLITVLDVSIPLWRTDIRLISDTIPLFVNRTQDKTFFVTTFFAELISTINFRKNWNQFFPTLRYKVARVAFRWIGKVSRFNIYGKDFYFSL